MMRRKRTAKKLLTKYRSGQSTEEERALLTSWYKQWHTDEQVLNEEDLATAEKEMWEVLKKKQLYRTRSLFNFKWIAAASIVVLLCFVAYHFYVAGRSAGFENSLYAMDANPGKDRATLKLANGTRIELDNLKPGLSIVQDGFKITKNIDGHLVYESSQDSVGNCRKSPTDISFNEITVPKGGKFEIHLPDGTKVWLNAASSLRYLLTFNSSQRKVELQGEAYFEVAKQEHGQPFTVLTPHQQIQVLGTHFNVNAYDNEQAVKTTLLQGSVKVSTKGAAVILKPNEQSNLTKLDDGFTVQKVDPTEAIAWKEGDFIFNNTDLKTIMRQLERWYDVEVVNLASFPDNTYNGKMKRAVKLSKVLQILELTSDLKFKIELGSTGRKERRVLLLN